ncbi:MAG: MATE family efflux transporter [Eubacteriales bacterium]|nr:MATE family efflux transporter [Eubacteriales bacterium]
MSDRNLNRQALFETMPVHQAVWTMAIPTIVTQLINIVYNYADTWFVGRSGNAAMVAAMGVSFPMYVILAALANLFGIGGSSVISRSLGEKNMDKARRTFTLCFWMGMCAAVLFSVLIFTFRSPLIYLVGGDKADFDYVSSYMFWTMAIGAIPSVGNVLCGHLIRSVGASKTAGFGMSMGGILNLFLDPLFMFVILPEGMEVTGAAVATLCSNIVAFLFFLRYMYRINKRRKSLNSRGGNAEPGNADSSFGSGEEPGSAEASDLRLQVVDIRPSNLHGAFSIVPEVLAVGIPAALQTTLAMLSNIFANRLIRSYGSSAVAGMGIAKKVNMIAFNTCMGMTMGVLPLLGYSFGAKNFDRFRKIVRYTGTVVVIYGICCTAVFISTAPYLVKFFIDEAGAVHYGSEFLRIIGYAAPFAAFTYLSYTVFQSAGMKWSAFLTSVMRKGGLDIPLMFLLRAHFGARGVCYATPAAEVLGVLFALLLYRRFRKNIRKEEAVERDLEQKSKNR